MNQILFIFKKAQSFLLVLILLSSCRTTIDNSEQNEHHKKKSFKDEYLTFLKEYNINYDERYVWD